MPKIVSKANCGNAPKNVFLEKLVVAFASGDNEFLLNSASEDIRWNIIGQKLISGKAEFAREIAGQVADPAAELTIEFVVSHGRAGAVNGRLIMENGKTYAFCDMFEFQNLKATHIKEITSYIIET